MKVYIGESVDSEGFVRGLVMKFENGLVLRTNRDMMFIGKENRELERGQFEEVVRALGSGGFEVCIS